jgi:dTMP kinase
MLVHGSTSAGSSPVDAAKPASGRGAFIVFEGLDRCGKTSQVAMLVQRLLTAGLVACARRFPDRTSSTGQVINKYLQNKDDPIHPRAMNLLFSANRWEAVSDLSSNLEAGTTIVCDRYAYSGVAFSAAQHENDNDNASDTSSVSDDHSMSETIPWGWYMAPDRGLPAPDCVLYLSLTPEQAAQRGG